MAGPLKTGKVKTKSGIRKKRIAIIVAEWNSEITEALYASSLSSLLDHGVQKSHVIRKNVPGTFELSLAALWMAERKNIDAVICLGCVIQGETPHFDYICQGVAHGLTEVALKTKKPVIFGVLTTLNSQQASDRAGGKFGNKGEEAALTALRMLDF
ncbi:MAG: 6,7-dimethyl-8-ribityllumazine synthase [Chryseolinea sp.]